MQSLKSKIDSLWLEFHSGGITNPITVIEQISYLMFLRLIDLNESRQENRAKRLGKEYTGLFGPEQQHLRWQNFKQSSGADMLKTVRDEAFPFLREDVVNRSPLGKYLKDANCMIPTGNLLVRAVNAIEALPLEKGDTKGDLYEYLLSKLQTAGIAGQFRTPRHIIRAMVELLDPQPTETVCDPACGTAGFLVGVMDYLKRQHSTPELIEEDADGEKHYPGDLLEPHRQHIQNEMFYGYDFDSTMLRIAAMNLLLHDVQSRTLHNQDTLVSGFTERYPKDAADRFDVILANPPFKGTIDAESTDPTLKSKVKTKKTELLFLVLILRMLKMGGRCAVIVPDGVLFGSSGAHLAVRQMLVDDHQLEAVVSLPSGVFKPYAGVSTAILVFRKGGRTDDVWFYDVLGDGFSLDDKRTPKPETDDLPGLLKQWNGGQPKAQDKRTKYFTVPVAEIRENKYDLSINRYKEVAYEEVQYDSPKKILGQLKELEQEILSDIEALEGMLQEVPQ
jgi:type I restriction enzyme M protein